MRSDPLASGSEATKNSERSERKIILRRSWSGARRTEVICSPDRRRRTGEQITGGRHAERNPVRARRWPGRRAAGGDYYLPERGTSAGQVVVSGGSGSARAECGRAHRFEIHPASCLAHMRDSRRVAFQTSPLLRLTISGTRQRAIRRVRWTV